jgi:hypothetical protein
MSIAPVVAGDCGPKAMKQQAAIGKSVRASQAQMAHLRSQIVLDFMFSAAT